ncbi:hypothetical protein [Flammeovirga sp. OC4]|uniref:hypothetical protein n=1 Tax=Flammeovirga sp. OC4 TaxID=1382345 RepID=UPI0005C53211|nr:hypothetical protein [Flammeovirga sp. OC4]
MKLSNFSKVAAVMSAFSLMVATSSCDVNDEVSNLIPENPIEDNPTVFHVAADVTDPDESVVVYMQPTTNISADTSLSFFGNGYEMDGTRSARITTAGGYVYNLDYGGGMIYELEYNGENSYTKGKEISVESLLGLYPRFAAVNDGTNDFILVHNVVSVTDEATDSKQVTLQVMRLAVPGLTFNRETDFVEHDLGTFAVGEDYVFRVDAPAILGGKLFYGTGYSVVGEPRGGREPEALATIALDWADLSNPTIVTSDASIGDTYGYRAKSIHVYEDYAYQINMTTQGSDVVITRLTKEGVYDDAYVFNITDKLGRGKGSIGAINWHHVGNGKGYVALDNTTIEDDNSYEIAYIDVVAKTVEVMDVPKSDMWYYQSGVVEGDKFYMAISPIGEDAYIWEFDGAEATKAAQLDGGNIFVQGIYK